jgi:hypothetical protein
MITKERSDEYRITMIGDTKELFMDGASLKARLTADGVWSDDQVDELLNQEVGYQTPKVKSVYV